MKTATELGPMADELAAAAKTAADAVISVAKKHKDAIAADDAKDAESYTAMVTAAVAHDKTGIVRTLLARQGQRPGAGGGMGGGGPQG